MKYSLLHFNTRISYLYPQKYKKCATNTLIFDISGTMPNTETVDALVAQETVFQLMGEYIDAIRFNAPSTSGNISTMVVP